MTANQNEDGELQLWHYVTVLWRRKLTILASMAVLALAGWLLGAGLATSYTSTAQVLAKPVVATVSSGTADAARDPAVVADEVAIMASDKVLGAVESKADHSIAATFLPTGLETRTESNTVSITVSGEDEEQVKADAQAIADTYVAARRAELAQGATTASADLSDRIAELDAELVDLNAQITSLDTQIAAETEAGALRGLENQRADLLPQRDSAAERRSVTEQDLADIKLTSAVNPTLGVDVLSSASDPVLQKGSTRVQYTTAGLALGLIIGVLLAFAREYLDRTVRTTRDVTAGVRILGVVPKHSQGASV